MYDQARSEGHTAGHRRAAEAEHLHAADREHRAARDRSRSQITLRRAARLRGRRVRHRGAARRRTALPAGAARPHAGDRARAGGPATPGATSIPYVDASRASSTVSFTAEIDAGVPIASIASPSHDIVTTPLSPTRQRRHARPRDEMPNRDLIVRYRTAGAQTKVGVLAHRHDDSDGYFLVAVQPKAQYRTGDIAARGDDRDRPSGSMAGAAARAGQGGRERRSSARCTEPTRSRSSRSRAASSRWPAG